jgi:peptidoglycan L-alanyl-D-glutamate endopeptidase CwlK
MSYVSQQRLMTCDRRLQEIVLAAFKRMDFVVLCGFRNEKDQTDAFEQGRSKVQWPNSRHNRNPSKAVDLAPLPINWKDTTAFRQLSDIMFEEAKARGVRLRWGGDFNMNGKPDDRFVDMPHYEIVDEKTTVTGRN